MPEGPLSLTSEQLERCRPVPGEGGRALRAYCPFHGGDRQRSLRVNLETGHFKCFACGAWGYADELRAHASAVRAVALQGAQKAAQGMPTYSMRSMPPRKSPEPTRDDLDQVLAGYQEALPSSWGEEYLRRRRIPLEVAQAYGVGYAPPSKWIHKARDWKWGRLVIPHSDPAGRLVNLYGRAVGTDDKVPKEKRHDHLPGDKAIFNAAVLAEDSGPLFVCEGPFDALSLIAAGYPRTVAIFGLNGWRWEWAREVHEFVLALDADAAGQESWRALARQACLRGKAVRFLPPQSYRGCKDINEAWIAGVLEVGQMTLSDNLLELIQEARLFGDEAAAAALEAELAQRVIGPPA